MFAFVTPAVLGGLVKYFNGGIKIVELISNFGYSLAIFIPCTLICIVSNGMLQSIVIGYSSVHSCVLIYRGYSELAPPYLIVLLPSFSQDLSSCQKYMIYGLLLGAQVILYLLLELNYF